MDRQLINYCMVIFLLTLVKAEENDRNKQDRQPRKNGRIVKVYSGSRPEPVHCTNEGFQADPHDCAVFYRCMKSGSGKYTVFRFQCGPGTVYDPETEVCNHPRNTKRSECGGLRKPLDYSNGNEIDEAVPEIPSPITTKRPVYTERPFISKSTPSVSIATNWFSENVSNIYEKPSPINEHSAPSGILTASSTSKYPTTPTNSLIVSNEIQYSPMGSLIETTTKRTLGRPSTVLTPVSDTHRPNSSKDICTSEGFVGDSENCHKFYRCVGNERGGFTRYDFSCSDSTIWDEDLQSCNHAWAVKKSRCGRSNLNTPDKFVLSSSIPSNSSEIFVEKELSPENNIEHINSTMLNNLQIYDVSKFTQSQTQMSEVALIENQTYTSYGQVINNASTPIELETQTQPTQNSTVNQTTTESIIDNSIQNSQYQIMQDNELNLQNSAYQQNVLFEEQKFSTTKSIPGSNNSCRESGFMRDQHDCKKFYRCVDNGRGSYTRYEYFCGEGTLWDSKIEGCNHAWAVKDCNRNSKIELTEQNPVTLNVITSTSTITSTLNSRSTTTYIPFVNATELNEDTGYGTHIQSSTISSSTNFEQSTKTDFLSECISDGFIGDKNDCKIFYRCVKNGNGKYTKIEFRCGDGTVWDPEIEACNHQWAVKKCGGSTWSEFNKIESTIKTTTPIAITTFKPSSVTTSTTESKETHNAVDYDSGYGITSEDSVYSSTMKTTKVSAERNNDTYSNYCQHSGFMGDKNDCKKFYRCVDIGNGSYTRYEFTCGQGTLWDPKIEACNHAWAVQSCGKEETTTTNYVTSSDSITTIKSTSSSILTSTEDKVPDLTTITSLTTSMMNECKFNGLFGDSRNCKKFYRCVDNNKGSFIKYEFQCGEGTVWDPKIEACNHEWAVEKCSNNIQNENSTLTSSSKPIINDEQVVSGGYPANDEPLVSQSDTTQTSMVTHSTSWDPSTYNECVKSGFMGDKQDCKKFYRCVENSKGSYIKYEFMCGEGTVWDQEIEDCNHAWAVKQCGSGDVAATEIAGSSTQNVVLTTTSGESITHYITEKNPTSNVEAIHKTSTYSPADIADSNTSQIPHVQQTICEMEGFYGNPRDCKKFYRCVDDGKSGFIKYEFICGDGTFWNNEIQACDHEHNSHKCLQNSLNTPTDKTTSTTIVVSSFAPSSMSSTQEEYTTHIIITSPQPGTFECVSDGFFANPHDCKKFIRCVGNGKDDFTKYEFKCGEGTVWVQEIQACDHDDKSESCKNQIANSTEITKVTVNLTSSTEKHQSVTPTTISTIAQTSLHQNDEYHTEKESVYPINDICSDEGFYGSKDNCKKFYRCVDNGHGGFIKYEFTCGEGTAWDDSINACNHAVEVSGCQSANQSQNEVVPVYHDNDSQQAITTKTSTTTEKSNFSESTQTIGTNNNDSCQSEGYFGDTQDCNKFYRCVHDGKESFIKYEYTCGDGTIWDQDITNCNHPNDVKNPTCKQIEENNHSSPSSSTTDGSVYTTSTTENNQGLSNCTQGESPPKPQNSNITCEEAGYYSDPNDCKKFYRCVDWNGDGTKFSVYHFTCSEGTIWDPVVETCNHEDSVYPPRDCSGTLTHTDNINQGSTSTESALTEESTSQHSSTHTTTESTNNSEHTTTDSTIATQSSTTTDKATSTTVSQQTTTTGQSTSEDTTLQSTTQISTTNKPTTTQQTTDHSTTNNQTTTQKTTTSEQTTQESSTSEETTTQKTSTSEQITQESSTTEETTTQNALTSEQTTQKSSTSEQTTSQETTISEQTTQALSTSEQTTTQNASTNEQTTQASSTSEQTITQKPSTSEETTQESSTSLQTTTQESSSNTEPATIGQTTQSESNTDTTTVQQTTNEQTTLITTDESVTIEPSTNSTTTIDEVQSTTEESSSVKQDCPDTEQNQYLFVCPTSFRRHHKYCNMFYQCTEDDDSHEVKIVMFTCPNNTIYDETKIQCVDQNKADKKCNGQMAKNRRDKRLGKNIKGPIMVGKYSQACPTTGHYPFERDVECSPAFLRCTQTKSGNIQGYIHQCPQGYVYWSISRRCEQAQSVRDCQRSRNDWSNRWEIPIDSSNIAT
ncbi:hypothetical protein K1T71_007242 [Dendrolimus kikuchii]|uniref:Uncharacterized protein n=1 Tax=Dendrolimus kikuchii TaxID=765133 RepID=A0ACC1CZX0_9NEOP|nr:hypothetical protein K1T71_007242 [Dendrolimus kikuchii]